MKDVKLDDFDLDIVGGDDNENDDGVSPASSISNWMGQYFSMDFKWFINKFY